MSSEKIEVSQVGSDVIRAKAREVEFPLNAESKSVIDRLVRAMREASLVGMAAPQVGESLRIFVTEIRKTKYRDVEVDPLRVFINPVIVDKSEETNAGYEGCGSVAESGLFGEVDRANSVSVQWQSEDGCILSATFEGFLARVIQHEIDHLDGIVFIDKLKTTQTIMSATEFRKKMT